MSDTPESPYEYGSDLYWLWAWGERLQERLSSERPFGEFEWAVFRPDRLARDAMMRFSIDYQHIIEQIEDFLGHSEKRFAEYLKCQNDSAGANFEFALLDLAGRISEAVTIIAENDSSRETVTVSDSLDRIQQLRPPDEQPKPVANMRPPSDDAIACYRAHFFTELNQTQLAEIMTAELKRPISQGQVSKWLKEVKTWIAAGNVLPDLPEMMRRKPAAFDPQTLELGPRQDHHTLRQREKRSENSDD